MSVSSHAASEPQQPRGDGPPSPVGAALEREHREIDRGIEAFLAGPSAGQDVTAALAGALAALRRHIYLEEELLFPPLRSRLMAPIFVMLREHGELWRTMDLIDAGLAGPAARPVPSACTELLAQLQAHNGKEEPIVYPQADATLTAEATAELRTFLESGRIPAGWVCHGARS